MTVDCEQEVPSGQCFTRMAYGPDNIIAAAFGASLQFLDADNGAVLETVDDAHDGSITKLQWGPTRYTIATRRVAMLATASMDKRVRFWRCPAR